MDILKSFKNKSIFHKALSLFVCAVMILSVFTVSIVARADSINVWSGSAATSFAKGTGTSGDPYIIENADQLYYLVSEVSKANNADFTKNKHFKITKDIYINDVSNGTPVQNLTNPKSWGNGLTAPDTSKKNFFYGTLDGGDHVIYGLYTYNYVNPGLFGAIANGAVVKNLGFDNLYFEGGAGSAGAVAGYANYAGLTTANPAKIEKCYVVNGSMVAGSSNKLVNAGGFIGNASNATIDFTNCYVYNVNFSATTCNASMIGKKTAEATVKVYNSYFVGKYPVTTTGNGHNKVKYYNVYTDQDIIAKSSTDSDEVIAKLSLGQMTGEAAKTYMQGFDFTTVWKTVANSYPVFIKNNVESNIDVWSGSAATSFAKGTGTSSDPYIIENADQLYYLVSEVSKANNADFTKNKHFKITKDIYINDVSNGTPVQNLTNPKSWGNGLTAPDTSKKNYFYGTLDGDGHVIYGLYTYNYVNPGLFGAIANGAVVKNLGFDNLYFESGAGSAGAVAGYANYAGLTTANPAKIENCYVVNGSMVAGSSNKLVNAGGFIGNASNATIDFSNCYVHDVNFTASTCNASMIGKKTTEATVRVYNSYFVGKYPVTTTGNGHNKVKYYNVYTDQDIIAKSSTDADEVIAKLTLDQMKGEAAKTNMQGFNFTTVWETVENDYPVLNVRDANIWDGTKISSLTQLEGKGTAAEPYLIKTGSELAYVVSTNLDDGLHFKLANDIKLNNTAKANWKDNARNWVWGNIRFVGTFDGDGHTIDGLYFKGSQKRFGLFSYTGDSLIKNIKFTNAYVNNTTSEDGVAIVAGQSSATTNFECIYIDATCSITAPNSSCVAGITARGYDNGNNADTSVSNCAVLATISGKSNVGAFVGSYWAADADVTIKNCFTTTALPIFGYQHKSLTSDSTNNYGVVTDNFGTTVLTPDQMKGTAAKTNMSGLDFNAVWETVDNDYPRINLRLAPLEGLWDGSKASGLGDFEGSGTADDPYQIENASQLAYVVTTDLDNGLYFKLVDDIKINDTRTVNWKDSAREWVQNTGIRAVLNLDGDGHTIDGLYFNSDKQRMGLFAYIGDSVVKNIKFTNASVTHTSNKEGIAIVAGQTSATSTFEAIYIDSSCEIIAPNGTGVAAIAARGYGTENAGVNVTNSAVLASITGKSAVGAYVGTYWYSSAVVTVTGCFTNTTLPIRGNNYGTTVAESNYGLAADDYNTNVVASVDSMKGDAAAANMPELNFLAVFETVAGDYPVINYKPDLLGDVWDGTKADTFAGGDGTPENPYQIENGAQLYKMVAEYSNVSAADKTAPQTYFRIMNDINLGNKQWYTTSITSWIDNAAYSSIGFNGVIYGDGHTIKNLNNGKGAGVVGLIPVATQGAQIYDLHIEKANLPRATWNTYAVGAFIGLAKGANGNTTPIIIKGCSVKDSTIGAANAAAGFVGYAYSQSVGIYNSRCVNTQISYTATSSAKATGFIAYTGGNEYLNTIVIANSYCTGVDPIPYLNEKFAKITTFSNVYTNFAEYDNSVEGVKKLTDAQMKGIDAKTNMKGFDFIRAWATVDNDYPAPLFYDRPDYIWDGSKASSFAGGTGVPNDPYIIKTGAQLYKMVSEYSNSSSAKNSVNQCVYFELANDIYLNDISAEYLENLDIATWNSAFNAWYKTTSYSKGFTGDLDGNGFTIYGLYCNEGYAGLIPILMDGGNIHHLNIENSYITGTESAGGIVGFVNAHYTLAPVSISYCTVDNVIIESRKDTKSSESNKDKVFVGGLVGGYADIRIDINDCSVTRSIVKAPKGDDRFVAGFIGKGWGNVTHNVTNCFTDSSVNPVTTGNDKAVYDAIADTIAFNNVYTTATKNFEAKGITYLSNDSELKGLNVANVLAGFDFDRDWIAIDNEYPAFKVDAGLWKYDSGKPGEIWTGLIARTYYSGNGTKESPYEIKTGGQLALLANDAINGKTYGRYYKITEDIILNDTTKTAWQESANKWYDGPWGKPFRGYLDGGYHIISGLYFKETKETYDNTGYYVGLFGSIGQNAVIEKLGIVNTEIIFTDDLGDRYVGAFAGFVNQYDAVEAGYDQYPIIRECFADTSVYLEGNSCGGFIGCAVRPIRIENSFFTGNVKGTSRGLFGYSKMNATYKDILVKNFYTANSKYAVISNNSYDNFTYENCYSSSAQDLNGLTRLFIDRMCGTEAAKYMDFDFENIWAVRGDNETPGLKGFDPTLFSNIMNPEDIVVSFETNCDIMLDSVTGKAYSKLELPVLKRDGYTFEGWYAYSELDVAYNYDYFPTFNTILYAKWTLNGFEQTFEQYEDSIYDYHEDYEYYRPTIENYSINYVHGGGKSMHRLGLTDDAQDFLLFYNEELEIGKKYKMVFYTTTDQDTASVDVSLVHLEWPDVYCENIGVEEMGTIKNLTDGVWQEFTFTFVARSKWVAIRTSGENSVYFDDFILFEDGEGVITPLVNKDNDKDKEETNTENTDTNNSQEDNNNNDSKDPVTVKPGKKGLSTIWIIAIVAGSVVVAAGIFFTVFFVIRKKR